MQYLVSVIDDGAGLATPNEEADISAFNDRLRAEGHWVFEAADLDVALKIAADGSKACHRKVEVRPFLGVRE